MTKEKRFFSAKDNAARVFVIAEAGVNHNGRLDLAKRLVDAAAEAGADCVKFQTYITEEDTAPDAPLAGYQAARRDSAEESQFTLIKRLELPFSAFAELKQYCETQGILFASSAFDRRSLAFLRGLGQPFWKVASSEVRNYWLLRDMARAGGPIILSTGMCEYGDIERALTLLRQEGAEDITLLHCNTEYPTPYEDVHLRAMTTLGRRFCLPYGYSDHTLGLAVPLGAVALGARVIEKHLTLDRTLPGPDHRASAEPDEFRAMTRALRQLEQALGGEEKTITPSEAKNLVAARKSLVAARAIQKGEVFSEDNVRAMRPGGGISPMDWKSVEGREAPRDFRLYEAICLGDGEEVLS